MDLDWQDGRSEAGRPAVTLLPRHHLDDREFWPDDLVQLAPDNLAGEQPGQQAPRLTQLSTDLFGLVACVCSNLGVGQAGSGASSAGYRTPKRAFTNAQVAVVLAAVTDLHKS